MKRIDLTTLLPSLLQVQNAISLQDDAASEGNASRPATILTLDQVVAALHGQRAELVGHACANGYRCKENWLQPGGESVSHRTTAIMLDVVPDAAAQRPVGGLEVRRVGPSQFICVGTWSRGMHRFSWDAGRRVVEREDQLAAV